jgi:hypothetical protein
MFAKTVRFASLFLTALLSGMLFCHVLEMPEKMKLSPSTWLTVQQTLYNKFGPTASVLEPLAIVFTLVALYTVRGRRLTFALTLVAAICLIAHLISWFAVVNPVNIRVNSWSERTIPANWTSARDRWEYGHAAGAGLALVALASLSWAALSDGSGRNDSVKRPAETADEATLDAGG